MARANVESALHARTVYKRRQPLLHRVTCLTVRLLASSNGAAILRRSCRRFQRDVGFFTNVWSTHSRKRFKVAQYLQRATFVEIFFSKRSAKYLSFSSKWKQNLETRASYFKKKGLLGVIILAGYWLPGELFPRNGHIAFFCLHVISLRPLACCLSCIAFKAPRKRAKPT